MPAAARSRRHRLPVLLWLALALLMLGAAALGRFYWLHLHASLDRLQASIAEARTQQWQMIQQVREAEAALAASAEQLGVVTATPERAISQQEGVWVERASLMAAAVEMERLAGMVTDRSGAHHQRIDWAQRTAELRRLGRDALRLPPARQAGTTIGGREVRALLEQAADAADLGDAHLVALILDAAARLLREHYPAGWPREPQVMVLAERIERVRGGIAPRTRADASAQLRQLASAFRAAAAAADRSRDRGDTATAPQR
jgi:hypothetical protein